MMFPHDMSLQSEAAKGSASDRRATDFRPGTQGFLMTSYRLVKDEDFRSGNQISLTFTYQGVGGFQLPEQVSVNRESHHEVWDYKLTGCVVETTKRVGIDSSPSVRNADSGNPNAIPYPNGVFEK